MGGETDFSDGGRSYRRPSGSVAVCVSGLVTNTLTVPSRSPVESGASAFNVVLLTKVTLMALFCPKSTVAPLTKLVPVIVIWVPPLADATVGEMDVMVGAGPACAGKTGNRSDSGAIAAIRRAIPQMDVQEDGLVLCELNNFIQRFL